MIMTRALSARYLEKSSIFNEWRKKLYKKPLSEVAERYFELTQGLEEEITFFSSPGRAEIVGNHTDHNNGLVLASTIDMDTIAAVQKTPLSNKIIINSQGYPPVKIDTEDITVNANEYGKSTAIVRGIVKGF